MNFVGIAHQDSFDLAASLRQKMGLFKEAPGGARVCEVRRPREDGKFGVPAYAAAGKWPELQNMLQRLKRIGDVGGGIEFGRIDLRLLPAGACMDWIIERDEAAQQYEHAIMMLRTSPAATWFAGPEVFMPAIGLLTVVSRRVPRSAINMGDASAIWLALDFCKKDRADG